jgi:hypothetical protein
MPRRTCESQKRFVTTYRRMARWHARRSSCSRARRAGPRPPHPSSEDRARATAVARTPRSRRAQRPGRSPRPQRPQRPAQTRMARRMSARRASRRESSCDSEWTTARGRAQSRRSRRSSGHAARTRRARASAWRVHRGVPAVPRFALRHPDGVRRPPGGSVRRRCARMGAPVSRLASASGARSRTPADTASRATPAIRGSGRSRSSGHPHRDEPSTATRVRSRHLAPRRDLFRSTVVARCTASYPYFSRTASTVRARRAPPSMVGSSSCGPSSDRFDSATPSSRT